MEVSRQLPHDYRFAGIPSRLIDKSWPKVSGFVEDALSHGDNGFSPDDIKVLLEDGSMQLWALVDLAANDVRTIAVTEIIQYPQFKCCRIVLAAGWDVAHWVSGSKQIIEWAKGRGCTHLQALCRKGLARVLLKHGYTNMQVVVGKEI